MSIEHTFTKRPPVEGDTCSCGRPAIVVWVVTDERGERAVPYCGIPDGGGQR